MSDPCVFVVKPGAVTAKDKSALSKAGVFVVETDDPASVRFIKPMGEVSSSEMLTMAMSALHATGSEHGAKLFVKLMTASMNDKSPLTGIEPKK